MPSSILDQLIALEARVWDALVAGDGVADAALLSPNFLGVYKSGFADRAEHSGQLDQGPTVQGYRISVPRVLELSPTTALLSYRAHYTRPAAPDIEEVMYVSSIWQRSGDGWVGIFSQDTDAEDELA